MAAFGLRTQSRRTHRLIQLVNLCVLASFNFGFLVPALTAAEYQRLGAKDQSAALRVFQKCISNKAIGTIDKTIDCIPSGCNWFYLNSSSAQNACTLSVQGPGCSELQIPKLVLPRLVLMCDNGRFAPTYGFCAKHDHVEIATYQNSKEIFLYDLAKAGDALALARVDSRDPERDCSSCHFYYDPDNRKPFSHVPIPIGAKTILGKGRTSEYVRLVCSVLLKASNQGCQIGGVYDGATTDLDAPALLDLCASILGVRRAGR